MDFLVWKSFDDVLGVVWASGVVVAAQSVHSAAGHADHARVVRLAC